MTDMVNRPPHYNNGKYETIDIIEDTLGTFDTIEYCRGNVIKYIVRMWNKGDALENARKAEWYLRKQIACMEKTKGVNW